MNPKKIFFLDAGRKYFSPDSVKKLLDAVSRAGLDTMELYFSDNQGFRFALNDMTLNTAWGGYDLTPALGDGYVQEGKAPDGSNRYWTEADVDEILNYAESLNIRIIPALNMPGHMGAILEHFPHLRYPGSHSSIDLRSAEARAFAHEILRKYAPWFAQRGCDFFNFGADEFANDLGVMGFEEIYKNGIMQQFVDFINELVETVTGLGLVPMAFNDGICYNNDSRTYGMIDNRLWVQHWTVGWNGYSPASPVTLANLGYHLVNTNQEYYIILGRCDYAERAQKAGQFQFSVYEGGVEAPETAAAMLCCWCDFANEFGTDDGAALTQLLPPAIEAFGLALK